jgi:hypothetical protein
MKLQKQPTDYTCGQTCVAMVADLPVEIVIAVVKKGPALWKGATRTKHLVRALKVLEIRCRRKLRRIKPEMSLPETCICVMRITGKRWGHWVVVHKQQIFDPCGGMNPQYRYGEHITSYLEIL